MVCAGGTVPLRRQGGVRWRWLEDSICTGVDGQQRLDAAELSAAGRQAVQAGLRQIERLNQEMAPLRRELARLSSRQPGCRALRRAHYGIGGLLSVAVWAELATAAGSPPPTTRCGTPAWTSRSTTLTAGAPGVTLPGKAPRCCAFRPHSPCPGVSVSQLACPVAGCPISGGSVTSGSEEEVVEQHRPQVRLPADGYRYTEKKQKECDGPLYEAALYASRPASPDYAYFCHVRDRIDGQRALLSGAPSSLAAAITHCGTSATTPCCRPPDRHHR